MDKDTATAINTLRRNCELAERKSCCDCPLDGSYCGYDISAWPQTDDKPARETMYEHITSMSRVELAEYLCGIYGHGRDGCGDCPSNDMGVCYEGHNGMLDYLDSAAPR